MASSWKNQHYGQGLTHSAVYRIETSPSPSKYYKRPSSNLAYIPTESYSHQSNVTYAPHSKRNDFMRSTIDTLNYGSKRLNTLNGQKETLYERQIAKITDIKSFENLKGTGGGKVDGYTSVGGQGEGNIVRNSKRKLENEQPLMNKIIKKLDQKQKLINQLKKISQTQLPTRNKKRSKYLSTTLTFDKPKRQFDIKSIIDNVISSGKGQSNLLKEKSINSPNQYQRNPQDHKQINNKTVNFHTPKASKHQYQFKNHHHFSAVTSLQTSPVIENKTERINLLKKKNVLTLGSSSFLSAKQNNYESVSFKKSNVTAKILKENISSKAMSLSDFRVLKTLGEGKFGTVQAAVHIQSGGIFALKKISKNVIRSHMMIDQLAIQIRIQSFCNHKNIVRLYNSFDDYDHLYLVLEYMEEGTLFSQLKKNKILTEKQAAQKVKSVAEAVRYLHQHGIAHRDIKPQNIVMSNGVSKLCDFGWAAICNERRRTYCGTFDYAAPQILQGSEYDMSVDMWCLGVLAYELMVGKAPFYHISRKETMKKIMNVDTSAIEFPSKLSHNAISFIKSLLKRQPEDRMNAETVLKHPFLAQVMTQ